MPRLAPSAKGTPTLFQHAMRPQMPSGHAQWQTIMPLASSFKNSIAVGWIIFGT